MALINCRECGKEISDQAAACINCGAPIMPTNEPDYQQSDNYTPQFSINNNYTYSKKKRGLPTAILIIVIVIVIGLATNEPKKEHTQNSESNTTISNSPTIVLLPSVSAPPLSSSAPLLERPEESEIIDVGYTELWPDFPEEYLGKWVRFTAPFVGERVMNWMTETGNFVRTRPVDNTLLNSFSEKYATVVGIAKRENANTIFIENAFFEDASGDDISLLDLRKMARQEEKEEVERLLLEEAEKREAAAIVEYKSECEKVSYSEISRNPNNNKGRKIKVTGSVEQILGEGSWLYTSGYRFFESRTSSKEWFIYYDLPDGDSRILEGDRLTFYGEFKGIEKFSRAIGGDVYIPALNAKYYE
jgi:hypothetical protein